MSTSEHREVAQLLLQKAQGGFQRRSGPNRDENQADHVIGFHLQQTVEKALKSVLASHAIEIPRTHDLGYLVELLSDIDREAVPPSDRRALPGRNLAPRRLTQQISDPIHIAP